MLKLPFSLTLASYIAAVEEPGPWAGVWDDKNEITGPVSKPIAHTPGSQESKCWGTLDVPRPFGEEEYGGREFGLGTWCKYGDEVTGLKCCTDSHDYWIREFEAEDLWPRWCSRPYYAGHHDLMCLVCDPK